MKTRQLTFHKNVKTLRKENKLTQDQMAEIFHYSRPIIAGWEKGNTTPNIATLDAICKYFHVSVEQMMYGHVASRQQYQTVTEEELSMATGEEELVGLLEEDIQEQFPPIEIDFGTIVVIAMALKKAGYEVTEIFSNGLCVFVKTKSNKEKMGGIIYGVGESIIHESDKWIDERRTEVENRLWEIKEKIITETMTDILGKNPDDYGYIWYDAEDNIRGYADSEEECKKQAQYQACKEYRIETNEE